jgi:hypothetical protein
LKKENAMSQHDGGEDDVSALLFFNRDQSGSDDDSGQDRQALIFSAADDGGDPELAIAALRTQAAVESDDTTIDVDALRAATAVAADEATDALAGYLVTVVNPPGTVTVKALSDGSVHEVDLSPKVVSMTESALADEILAIADLARQKGLAKHQAFIADIVRVFAEGGGQGVNDELIIGSLELPTPQDAEAAQAEVFATRYSAGTD